MQPIDVVDTAVKIGLGAIVGGLFGYFLERSKQKNERIKEIRRLKQERIIDPIVAFIDELLVPMSEAYWSHLDKVKTDIEQKVVTLRNKEAMIDARVAALGNKQLGQKFSQLTTRLSIVRDELAEGKIVKARSEMHNATTLAGEIIALLFKNPC